MFIGYYLHKIEQNNARNTFILDEALLHFAIY